MVVSESVFVHISLKVEGINTMMDSVYSSLGKTPETFDVVGMNDPISVFAIGMTDLVMGVSLFTESSIPMIVVSEDNRTGRYPLLDFGVDSSSPEIWNYLGTDVPFPLNHAHNDSLFVSTTATLPAMRLPADIGVVNLDLSGKRVDVLSHEFADLAEHSPGCLVGDSQFSFKLFCGDTTSGRSHQEYSIEPMPEWSR